MAEKTRSKEVNKAIEQIDAFEQGVQDLTMDRLNATPKEEVEPQTKLAQSEIAKLPDVYLKPHTIIGSREKFNEDYRQEYNFAKEYVQFIAENKEIIGEAIEIWTKPFAGMPAEFWKVPTNKPIYAPRYVAEQIKRKFYHRLVMKENVMAGTGQFGSQFYGQMAADTTVQRLDAIPVSQKKSVFMGVGSY